MIEKKASKNSHIIMNKQQVMEQLLTTFTNKSYLNQLKQNNKEIEQVLML